MEEYRKLGLNSSGNVRAHTLHYKPYCGMPHHSISLLGAEVRRWIRSDRALAFMLILLPLPLLSHLVVVLLLLLLVLIRFLIFALSCYSSS